MAGAFRTITVALNANPTGYVSGLRLAARETHAFDQTTAKSATKASGAWAKVGLAAAGAGAAVAVGLGLAAKAAIDFESAFAGVEKTVDATDAQMAKLRSGILEMASTLPATAGEIAGVAESAGALGIKTDAILGFTKVMVDLGETTNLTADEAATSMAKIANIMQTPQDEFDRLGSTLVDLGNKGASTEADIVAMALRIAGAGKVVGASEADVLGLANALSSLGIEAEAGGSAISRVMGDMAMAVSQGGQHLEDIAEVAGMTGAEFSKAFKEDAAQALVAFVEGMGKAQKSGEDLFGILAKLGLDDIRVRDTLLRLAGGGDLLAESLRNGGKAWDENSALAVEASKRYATIASQLEVLRNRVTVAAIALGTELLPGIQAVIDGLKSFGNDALPFIRQRLADLQETGANLVEVLQEIWRWAGDAAEMLAMIGGAAVLGALTALTETLAAVTGFLAEHPALIRAITAALIVLAGVKAFEVLASGAETFAIHAMYAWDAVAGSRAGTAMTSLNNMTRGFGDLARGADGAAGSIKSGFSGIVTSLGPITAAIVVITAAIASYQGAVKHAKDESEKFWDPWTEEIDLSNITQVRESLETVRFKVDALKRSNDEWANKGVIGAFRNLAQNISPAGNTVENLRRKLSDSKATLAELEGRVANYNQNMKTLREETGLSEKEVGKLANTVGVDLTTSYAKTEKGRQQIVKLAATHKALVKEVVDSGAASKAFAESLDAESVAKIAEATSAMFDFVDSIGLLGPTVVSAEGMSAEAYEKMTKDAEKFITDVKGAFDTYGNIIGAFGDQQKITGNEIEKFYKERIGGAREFMADIKTAIDQNLDPQFIARALQAGPEEAGPLLDTIVSDHSGRLRDMVNESEEALREISRGAAEMARLMNQAVTGESDKMTKNLDKAMDISQIVMRDGGKASAEAIAHELGIGVLEVAAIAKLYGISLADGINPVLKGVGARTVHVGGTAGRGFAVAQAEGGYLSPADYGDTRRDTIPAMLMPGEVVIRRDSVRKFGVNNLLDLNRGRMPSGWRGYAAGGFVDVGDVPKPPDVSNRGDMVGFAGGAAMQHAFQKVVDYIKKNAMMSGIAAASGPVAPGSVRALAQSMLAARGWGQYWNALDTLVMHESGWRPTAQNPTSSAYGLFQFLDSTWGSVGGRKTSDPGQQIAYGLRYIAQRYGNPAGAWSFWSKNHWYGKGGEVLPYGSYDRGGYLPKGLSLAYNGTGQPEPVGGGGGPINVSVNIGGEVLDVRINRRIDSNNRRVAVEARKR